MGRSRTIAAALALALTAWGGYTLIVWLGVPAHGELLVSDAQRDVVRGVCTDTQLLCRGARSLVPFLITTVERAGPFARYAGLCLIAATVFAAWRWTRRKRDGLRVELSPALLVLLFIASAWLLLATIRLDGITAFLPEPGPRAYSEAAPQTREVLQANHERLDAAGCLGPAMRDNEGMTFRRVSFVCSQKTFVTRVLPHVAVVLVLSLELLVLGSLILNRLKLFTPPPPLSPPSPLLVRAALSASVGTCAWIAILWLTAQIGLLKPAVGWGLILLVPAIAFRETRYWITQLVRHRWTVDLAQWTRPLLAWILIGVLALNFIHVIRPFPIGWDDMGSYLMRPRVIAEIGRAIHTTATFQWEFLTSLGFLLFGPDTPFGATAAQMVNWFAGVFAVISILAFGAVFLGAGGGLLAAALYYALPMVGHFSYADMKIDNAVFAICTVATLVVFVHLFGDRDDAAARDRPDHVGTRVGADGRAPLPFVTRSRGLLLAGILVGFAVAMKLTAAIVATSLGLVIAVATLLTRWRNPTPRAALWPAALALTWYAAGGVAAAAPWLVVNNVRRGNIIPQFEVYGPNQLTPLFTPRMRQPDRGQQVRVLPDSLAVNRDDPSCVRTGRGEELDRYAGPEDSGRFTTLWWRTAMNLDVAGFYVTLFPAVLLAPLAMLTPAFRKPEGRWLRWLALATVAMGVQWTILAHGVPWYGLPAMLGLLIALEFMTRGNEKGEARSENSNTPDPTPVPEDPTPVPLSRTGEGTGVRVGTGVRKVAVVLISLSIMTAVGARLNQFQAERVLLDYPLGKLSADAMRESIVPHYDRLREIVEERARAMPDRPYVFRVGTYAPYFLAGTPNLVGLSDNQLNMFNCLFQERNARLTAERLRALGFNSIIFDTGVATIERDPNGTLHAKAAAFVAFTREAPVRIVINDPDRRIAFLLLQ